MLCIDLRGKKALITGSTRGIGKAIAEYLAKAGADVIITGRDPSRAQEVAQSIAQAYGVNALGVAMDFANLDSVKLAYQEVEKVWGGVDILVNNAGITKDKLFLRMSLEDWEEVIKVNLTGTFYITSLALKGMLKPVGKEVVLGSAEVRGTFKIKGVGTVAGCYVLEGKVVRNARARLIRGGVVIYEGKIETLKRYKEDVQEVARGYECGIKLSDYNDIKVGDVIECYEIRLSEPQL
jgi:NAD(P)-dependent dehydrogenase (short-subunit alcohol dehydrogenase family)